MRRHLSTLAVALSLLATGCGREHHHHHDFFPQQQQDPNDFPLASGLGTPASLVVDDTAVYYADAAGGTVGKVPLSGGTVQILATGVMAPTDIALDGTTVYCCAAVLSGSVISVPKAGGAVATVATATGVPRHIVADATHLYWADADTTGSVASRISMIAKVGSATPAALTSGVIAISLATDGTFLYAYEVPPNAGFSNLSSGKIARIDPASGHSVVLATGLANGVSSLTASGGTLYWIIVSPGVDTTDYGLAAMPVAGGVPTELVQRLTNGFGQGAWIADGLGLDAGSVFFLANRFTPNGDNPGQGTIDQVSKTGNGPIAGLTGFWGVGSSFATDAANVYWAVDDTIYVRAKNP
jgi:hypothetical protein